jgi:hypothetical protein
LIEDGIIGFDEYMNLVLDENNGKGDLILSNIGYFQFCYGLFSKLYFGL